MSSICGACQSENDPDADSCFTCGRALAALTQGSLIASRYEILEVLGKGGMGVVYKAHDRLLDEHVAIKVLRREYINTAAMAARFRAEIKLARRVTHPNVCRIHEYGEEGSVSYISMALLQGTDLRQVVLEHPSGLPVDVAFDLSIQVASGLKAIHDVGIVHRDLKPANILREPGGGVYLMDFGIAKQTSQTGVSSLTATGEVMGTPEYMSPEQCRGDVLDVRSDLYSLGIVMFELFTGEVPFRGPSLMATMLRQIQEPVRFDGPAGRRLPPGVEPVLRRTLAKEPTQRPANAAEVLDALQRAREAARRLPAAAQAAEAPPPTPGLEPARERRRHSRLTIHLDLRLRRLGADGSVLEEERTVADNLSRRGMRVRTSMTLALGDRVSVEEIAGDFKADALVRSVFPGSDGIRRLGLELVEREAPDRLVPSDSRAARALRRDQGSHMTAGAAAPVPTAERPYPADQERRRWSRFDVAVDVLLRRRSLTGRVLQEERTIADKIGRGGARVMTALAEAGVGDVVEFEEVGASFKTRAVVRSSIVGPDRIARLGLEFLDCQAPDRLVLTDTQRLATPKALKRPERTPAAGTAVAPADKAPAGPLSEVATRREQILRFHGQLTQLDHYALLGLTRAAQAAQLDEAYVRLAKQFDLDVARQPAFSDLGPKLRAIRQAIGQAFDVLRDPVRRAHYTKTLPEHAAVADAAPRADVRNPVSPPVAPVASRHDPDEALQVVLRDARALVDAGRHWDAIQLLEPATKTAPGTRVGRSLQILLAEAISKNPRWLRRAEAILKQVVREDAANVEAHYLLGTIYRTAGLKRRAHAELRRVLDLEPAHKQAPVELAAVEKMTRDEDGID